MPPPSSPPAGRAATSSRRGSPAPTTSWWRAQANPDFSGSTPNNNTLSSILVVDENRNVVHRYEQFNFFGTFLFDIGAYLQLSSATSRAFALGPA